MWAWRPTAVRLPLFENCVQLETNCKLSEEHSLIFLVFHKIGVKCESDSRTKGSVLTNFSNKNVWCMRALFNINFNVISLFILKGKIQVNFRPVLPFRYVTIKRGSKSYCWIGHIKNKHYYFIWFYLFIYIFDFISYIAG